MSRPTTAPKSAHHPKRTLAAPLPSIPLPGPCWSHQGTATLEAQRQANEANRRPGRKILTLAIGPPRLNGTGGDRASSDRVWPCSRGGWPLPPVPTRQAYHQRQPPYTLRRASSLRRAMSYQGVSRTAPRLTLATSSVSGRYIGAKSAAARLASSEAVFVNPLPVDLKQMPMLELTTSGAFEMPVVASGVFLFTSPD